MAYGPRKDILARIPSGWEPIASNNSYWQWEYDMNERTAIVAKKDNMLKLWVIEVHEKSGIGAGTRYAEKLEMSLGTIDKPQTGKVASAIKPFAHQKSIAGSGFKKIWYNIATGQEAPLDHIIDMQKPNLGENKLIGLGPYVFENDNIVKDEDNSKKLTRPSWTFKRDSHELKVDNRYFLKNAGDVEFNTYDPLQFQLQALNAGTWEIWNAMDRAKLDLRKSEAKIIKKPQGRQLLFQYDIKDEFGLDFWFPTNAGKSVNLANRGEQAVYASTYQRGPLIIQLYQNGNRIEKVVLGGKWDEVRISAVLNDFKKKYPTFK